MLESIKNLCKQMQMNAIPLDGMYLHAFTCVISVRMKLHLVSIPAREQYCMFDPVSVNKLCLSLKDE